MDVTSGRIYTKIWVVIQMALTLEPCQARRQHGLVAGRCCCSLPLHTAGIPRAAAARGALQVKTGEVNR